MPLAVRKNSRAFRNRAFSIIELVVVLLVLVIIVAMMFGRSSRVSQVKLMSLCEKNLQNIYLAFKTYGLDNSNAYPVLAGATTSEPVLSLLIPRYTTGTEYFICPGSGDAKLPDAQPFANLRISYAYYMGHTTADGADQPLLSDRQINTLAKSTGAALFSPDGKKPGNNHYAYGGNVLFCDGNVSRYEKNATNDLPVGKNITLLNPKP